MVAISIGAVAALLMNVLPSGAAPSDGDLDAARRRLADIEREFQLAAERYNRARTTLDGVLARVGASQLEIDRIERRLRAKQAAAVDVAVELYKSGSIGTIDAVLSARSLAELETAMRYAETSQRSQLEAFAALHAEKLALQAQTRHLQAGQQRAVEAETELSAWAEDLEQRVADQRDEISRLNSRIQAAAASSALPSSAAIAAPASSIGVTLAEAGGAPAPNPRAQTAVDAALSQVGKPYQWAGAGPDTFDCSGLTMWAWAKAGVALPHYSGAQFDLTPRIAVADWQPGDLLFFGSPIHHVGMYIGNSKMVEAPYTGERVRIGNAMRSDYVGAGRPGSLAAQSPAT